MNINFDSRTVAPSQPMEPVPEGWYPVVISEEEQRAVAAKPQCWFLSLTMEIIDGPMKGRKLFTNLNLGNDNQQAVEIAGRELSAICHVTGQFVLNEQSGGTAALKGKPFMVKAVVTNSRNEVKGYKDMAGNDPGKTGGQAHAPVAPQMPGAPLAPPPAPPTPPAPSWGIAQPAAAPAPQWQQPAAPVAPAPGAWTGGPAVAPAAAPAPAQPAWSAAATPMPAAAPWAAR